VHGAAPSAARTPSSEAERILRALLRELSVKQSAALASEITGVNRRKLYQLALSLQRR
jgi:16S rRNA (cytidine1402-2'-O)-methyltransferase